MRSLVHLKIPSYLRRMGAHTVPEYQPAKRLHSFTVHIPPGVAEINSKGWPSRHIQLAWYKVLGVQKRWEAAALQSLLWRLEELGNSQESAGARLCTKIHSSKCNTRSGMSL